MQFYGTDNIFDANASMYMQNCYYPIEYHNRYGCLYPGLGSCNRGHMIYPIMYPEIYYKIYPYAYEICEKMDNPYMIYPPEPLLENMIDECYDLCMREMPELEEYCGAKTAVNLDVENKQAVPGRRRIFRDLIGIILISELFRRRRLRF